MRLRLPARLWFELDILPVIVETRGWSIDERACSGARKAQLFLVQNNIPRIASGYRHRVEVDGNGRIHMCDAIDYEKTVSPQTWGVLQQLLTVERDLRITFFSSTPQGGGVALMRHALIRILHLMGVEAQWYVMKPKPEVFDITKRKFHNVLQGVAGPDVHLNDHDKRMYEHWCKDNITRYWTEGPIVQSDVIIIDDPQPAGLIRYIKHLNPRCKIIYRSHIEVRSDLADNPETEQHHVWNYLWQFIQHADLFISHPVANFVPSNVPRDRLLMLPAATDPLDGLNKELDPASTMYYHAVFNRLSIDTTGRHIDFARPYIIQIARFDPSKGIPDVLKAFRLLRRRMEGEGCSEHELPQLVLCGHGSIDDPDGNLVFEQVLSILEEDQYLSVLDDIAVVRLPPSDQLLDTLMRGAKVALQLSTREGFEIKVTEALAKGRPVVAYAAGGIPHQIHDGCNGYLVKIGDVDTVVQRLYELLTDDKLYRKMSRAAVKYVSEEYFTVKFCSLRARRNSLVN
ncbi:hypothetical protein BC832DRAFT_530386 [Gaertneriomyces semiglobifer]|nr:hypothetical protein BC832DRAFT_530386 [Gaertneriomyces semiglobifer]